MGGEELAQLAHALVNLLGEMCIRDSPVGARTIDAVKRRTRAGMGRCQGGFCSPRVLEILSEELGIDPTEVTKCGGESRLLVGTIAEAARKEDA